MSKIVELKNIFFSFPNNPILKNFNFNIEEKDFIAIIGPNGGGKTTIVKIILGLINPQKGEVLVFGKKPKEVRNLIGYLPQISSFDSNFPINVFDVVLMGRYGGVFKKYSKEDKRAVEESLKIVEMIDFKDTQIGKLSGGQIQRVFLARALVRSPRLLLLDEPLSSIDPSIKKSFYDLILELNKKMSIVLITHDVGTVSAYTDKIACLNRELFYYGPKEEAFKKIEDIYDGPVDIILHNKNHEILHH